ncbi:MAG: hypothetical protein K2X77_12695 [Candidatus Obscuribacterales bacterium]|nr:hypothetical protein [Candidatus Obscuribacterales bacterium]
MEKDHVNQKALAQNEVTLAALRAPALELLQKGIESSYSSQATKTDRGLEVTTVNDNDSKHVPNLLIVDGKTKSESGLFNVALHGDFNITHKSARGQWQEKATFDLVGSHWDHIWGRDDKFNASIKRMNAEGKAFQIYAPAITEEQDRLDPNGQPIRIAKLAGDQPNAGIENIASRGDRRFLTEYIVDNKLSFNESRTQYPAMWERRTVVRDLQGKVLGIMYQDYKLDGNGDITSVSTSARKPMKLRQGN